MPFAPADPTPPRSGQWRRWTVHHSALRGRWHSWTVPPVLEWDQWQSVASLWIWGETCLSIRILDTVVAVHAAEHGGNTHTTHTTRWVFLVLCDAWGSSKSGGLVQSLIQRPRPASARGGPLAPQFTTSTPTSCIHPSIRPRVRAQLSRACDQSVSLGPTRVYEPPEPVSSSASSSSASSTSSTSGSSTSGSAGTSSSRAASESLMG